jgi:hypothetical protein
MNTNRHKIHCNTITLRPFATTTTQQERLTFLKECWRNNCFTPYQRDLERPVEKETGITWWESIDNYARSRRAPLTTDINFLCCYLFAAALSDSPEKHTEFIESINTLSSEQLKNFYQALLVIPPVMGAKILNMSTEDSWDTIIYKTQNEHGIVFQWMEIAVKYFPQESMQNFIHELMTRHASKDFFYSYLTLTSTSAQRTINRFLQAKELDDCNKAKAHLEEITKQFFETLKERKLVKFPKSPMERNYVLQQFTRQISCDPQTLMIISHLSLADWNWIYKQIPQENLPAFLSLIVDWVLQMNRSQDPPSFLRYLPSILCKEDLQTICLELAKWYFFSVIESHLSSEKGDCLPILAESHPQILNAWVQYIISKTEPMNLETILRRFLEPLQGDHFKAFLVNLFAEHETNPTYALTVYACMPTHTRKVLLSYLIEHNKENILLDWIQWLLFPSEKKPINPFIRHSCLHNLNSLLESTLPSFAAHFKKEIQIPETSEAQEAIELYLPPLELPSDFEESNRLTLQRIVRYFSDPEIQQYGRNAWTQGILSDFTNGRLPATWIEILLENIPKNRWPFLFRTFHLDIYHLFVQQKAERLTVWIERVATTLQETVSLPITLEEKLKYCIDLFATITVTEPEHITSVLQKIVNPPELFLPCLQLLHQYFCHEHQENMFLDCLSSAFQNSQDPFLETCLLSHPITGTSRIEYILWKKIGEKWKKTMPTQEQFHEQIEKIHKIDVFNGTKKHLLHQLCTAYLNAEGNVFKWLEMRPHLLQSIKTWYLPFFDRESWKPSLLTVGLLNLISPTLLQSLITKNTLNWNNDNLNDFLEILDQLDLIQCYLDRSTFFQDAVLRMNADPTKHPFLFRTRNLLEQQIKTSSCHCIIS